MWRFNRKSDPKVIGGKVQRKNNASLTPRYVRDSATIPAIERQNPGKGYRHLVTRRQLEQFLALLPDWDELSIGLTAVVLARGTEGCDGWHAPGVVAVCAWERELWRSVDAEYYHEHAELLSALGVDAERIDGELVLKFTHEQATAFQLMHVLLHELGHHHDRMTTKSRSQASRGDGYAEKYANAHAAQIWTRYVDTFGPLS